MSMGVGFAELTQAASPLMMRRRVPTWSAHELPTETEYAAAALSADVPPPVRPR